MQAASVELGLSEAQRMIRESVLPLVERALPRQKIRELDEAREFPFDAYAALAGAGWLGLPHEAAYGGADGGFKDLAILVETIACHSAQLASAYLTSVDAAFVLPVHLAAVRAGHQDVLLGHRLDAVDGDDLCGKRAFLDPLDDFTVVRRVAVDHHAGPDSQ